MLSPQMLVLGYMIPTIMGMLVFAYGIIEDAKPFMAAGALVALGGLVPAYRIMIGCWLG
jgi:hypothetical protein